MSILELSFTSKEDSLSVRRFAVREEISGLFEVTVLARSPLDEIDLEGIVGQGAGFALNSGVAHLTTTTRVWTGICSHMELVHAEPTGLSTYSLTIVPALWRTTLRRNNRIFQHLTIPEIVSLVLTEWQIEPELRLTAQYLKHEYRAQYDETDFAFINRLLEEAGIAYFFTHDGPKSVLVLSDDPTTGDARPPLHFVDNPNQSAEREFVTKVKLAQKVKPGRFTIRDFDFRNKLDAQLFAEARAATEATYEQYLYEPGAFWYEPGQGGDTPVADDKGVARTNPDEGDRLVQRNLDAERRARRALAFETNVVDLSPGTLMTIDPHPRRDISGRKLLVIESTLEGEPGTEWTMTGRAVYADVTYRPERRTPRPRVLGVQSAVVVGPPGEEIYVDEMGRVRVQFHWDREGSYDDNSAAWIRVSQDWAGSGYGLLNLPRVGHEVLVEFFEGNPDRPVITGRVFSYTRRVLYKLPDDKTKSGWKTMTYPGAGGFNELSFEDATGREVIHVQAQKDFSEIIKNDQTSTVRNDRSASVTANDSMTVGGNQTFTVTAEQHHTVFKVQKNDVTDDRTSTIGHDDTIDAGDVITGTVGPGVGYMYNKDQFIIFTNGVASAVFTPDGLFLDAKGNITISAGKKLKLSGKQVVIDGKPNVYFNRDSKRLRLQERQKLINDALAKAEGMPDGPERDALLAAASRLSRNNRSVESARLAADVYNETGAPEGWTRLQNWSAPSGFFAAAYRSEIDGRVVVAYRGTEPTTWQDWGTNIIQGAGAPAAQHASAASVARQARAQYGESVEHTGHSLGGGLAATGAMASNGRADTFNAAGVHPNSYGYFGLNPAASRNINNYRVDGEVLTSLQESTSLMPDAAGNQIDLPAVQTRTDGHGNTIMGPDGKPSFTVAPPVGFSLSGALESVDRHSRYIDGIEFQKWTDIQTMRSLL
jgi:type VI secretion system secreted protein VgrG